MVRQRSAKPLYPGSNPGGASLSCGPLGRIAVPRRLETDLNPERLLLRDRLQLNTPSYDETVAAVMRYLPGETQLKVKH